MTNEDLKNYNLYLKEEEERATQILYVLKRRQEQKVKRAHEKETLVENEAKAKREKEEKEIRKKRQERKERKRRERKERGR